MLYFDIETVEAPDAKLWVNAGRPPSNYKKEESIQGWIVEDKAKKLSKAALNPDLCNVEMIAIAENGDEPMVFYYGEMTTDPFPSWVKGTAGFLNEAEMLSNFWLMYSRHNGRTCGYNTLNFDFPVILRRSFALGLDLGQLGVHSAPNLGRYGRSDNVDLMQILCHWGTLKYTGLKWTCKKYGIEHPVPDVDGEDYATMSFERKVAYARGDVVVTRELYKRMQGIYL